MKSLNSGQNLSIKDTITDKLPGERWKDIPGFEGLYRLSDYGRVKSLSRWVYKEKGADAYRPGRIIKLRFTPPSRKKKKSETDVDIQMKLNSDGIRYCYSVARYVYYLYVAQFDLEDNTIIVRRKDNNNLNCYFRNLQLNTRSEAVREGFEKNNRKTNFHDQIKPVSQYSLEGIYVETFSSSRAAGMATGVSSRYINDAARTKVRPTAGAYWRYGKPKNRINVAKLKSRLEHALRVKKRKVEQLTLNGRPVKTFDSASQAAKAMNMRSHSCILLVCKGKHNTCRGYKWRYAD